MKEKYEAPFRSIVPQRTNLIVRVDGRSFHTYTRSSEKPYDRQIAGAMDAGAQAVCSEMMGCRFAYGQSDEYSFLATDFDSFQSEAWFNGNVQKIASIAASISTSAFNLMRLSQTLERGIKPDGPQLRSLMTATFDARAFVIPSRSEVENYFVWRQQDAIRNSLNMLASCHYSHRELHNVSTSDRHELLQKKASTGTTARRTRGAGGLSRGVRGGGSSATCTRGRTNASRRRLRRVFGNSTVISRCLRRIASIFHA